MAQTTSELWKELINAKGTKKEYYYDIAGTTYYASDITESSSERGLYDDFSFGNAYIGSLKLSLFADNIPRGAKIKRYIRLVNEAQTSEWLPYGTYYINRRTEDEGYWTIEAYDSMRKAEKIWVPDDGIEFPCDMRSAVTIFAALMGVEIDSRTQINSNYTIDYPANDYTIRTELCYIAAAHGGNWIMTSEDKLLLIPLLSTPKETNYLVDEHGSAITLGGVRLLV